MAAASYIHDPQAVLDYEWDWTAWLTGTEAITSHTVDVEGTVAVDSTGEASGVVVAWISGGVVGDVSKVTCHIVTDAGREDDRTKEIRVMQR